MALGLLEMTVRIFGVYPVILEAPTRVVVEIWKNPSLYLSNTWVTLYEVLVGFGIAAGAGVLIGALIVYSRFLQETIYPLIVALQLVPKVAVAPLLVVFLGYGPSPKIAIALLLAFFPIVVNSAVGMREVAPEYVDLLRVLNGNRIQEFFMVRIPSALPYIFGGLKLGVTLAVIGAVIGEFVGANAGLGHLVVLSNTQLKTEMTYSAITLLSLIGLVSFGSISLIEKLSIPWSNTAKGEEQ